MTADVNENLAKQIAAEQLAIENAPIVSPGPPAGRCHWCGQLAQEVEYVDELHGVERYRGVACCGRRGQHTQVRVRVAKE